MGTYIPMGTKAVNGLGANDPVTNVPASENTQRVELWERVKLACDRSGRSMRSLSEAIGRDPKYVQKLIERAATRPDAVAMAALARETGVAEGWLVYGRGSPDGSPDDRDDAAQAPAPEDVDAAGRRPVATDASRSHRPLLENLPDWPELLAGARQIATDRGREIPDWAWVSLSKSGALLTGPLTAAAVFDLAKTYADVWRLALALGAPRAVLRRLRAAGRCTALHVAAETGIPAWAAAWRLGAIAEG